MIQLSLLLALSPLPQQADVALFQGAPGGVGDVVIVDPTQSLPPRTPPKLAGVRLLPLDFNGRTLVQEFLPDRPRLVADLPGASRLVLPNGQGSLYRYARDVSGGGTVYGLFLVGLDGDARSVFELQGTGPAADLAPFQERVAVSPDGRGVLLATHPAAGGDLFEIDLPSGSAVDRTSQLGAQRLLPAGLFLHDDWGVGVTSTGVLRFERAIDMDAASLAFPAPAPTWFSGELAWSANGQHAVTTAGTAPVLALAFTFGRSGPAVQAGQVPALLSGAGYLPESEFGPYLAVSDDGSRCAWREETTVSHEAFCAVVAQPVPPLEVTGDALYLDTLDEVGQFIFRTIAGAARLALMVGEVNTGGGGWGIENLDLYEVELSSQGAPTFTNVTLTNNDPTAPFQTPSDLSPQGMFQVPGSGKLVFFDELSGGTGRLVSADLDLSGVQVLMTNVKELDWVRPVNGNLLAMMRRSNGNKDRELHWLPAPWTGSTRVLAMPDFHVVERFAVRPDGATFFVQEDLLGDVLWRFSPTQLVPGRLTSRRLVVGSSLGLTAGGELAFTAGTLTQGSASIAARWPTSGGPSRLPVAPQPGFVLPAQ